MLMLVVQSKTDDGRYKACWRRDLWHKRKRKNTGLRLDYLPNPER